jgi:hypothetical protein
MDTEKLECLLERLVTTNEMILDELRDIRSGISELKDEFNWAGEFTYGKMVYEGLNSIESNLDSVESSISNTSGL